MQEETAARQDEQTAEAAQGQLGQIAFVGTALSPFFLEDPLTGSARASFAAMAALDLAQAAQEWPFVSEHTARESLEDMAHGAQDTPEQLAHEFRRLFVGPAHKAAPPWGSVYTDRERVVFGESTLALRRWMHERGLNAPNGTHTPEDHIGLLLALMAQLACEASDDLDDFLVHHLLSWSGHFLQIMEQQAQHPFYRGLAKLTAESLAGIARARHLDVVEPKFYR